MLSPRSVTDTPLLAPERCGVIAEVAQAHDGSLGTAHAYIDAIARAGADAVKFQTHIAAAESTPDEPWRVKFSPQDATRYEYWQRMEFSEEQWHGLRKHAEEVGLHFLSSPFSVEAVELLERVGVAAWKIASGQVTDLPMLERMARSKLPFLISTGMSPVSEIRELVEWVRARDIEACVFQCTSSYPTTADKLGLNVLGQLRTELGVPVGLSDHSGEIYAGLAAATLGAQLIEVHVTFSKDMFGPDVPASLMFDDLERLVTGVRFIREALDNPVDKDAVAAEMATMRRTFTKSLVLRTAVPEGGVIERANLASKKPGVGISASELDRVAGRKARANLSAGHFLQESDLA